MRPIFCVCVHSSWVLILCLLGAECWAEWGSEGVLIDLATHLFYWKSLDCFCSAPRLPLSVSLPLMKLQMNWSTYWLLSFSPPLTHRPPQCLYHTSWLSLCMSLSLLLSLSSLISLFLSSSHASILFITFVTLSPTVLILPILSVSLLTNFPVHLTFSIIFLLFYLSSFPPLSSKYEEGNVLWRCCLPAVDKSILMDWLAYMTHSDGLITLQQLLSIHSWTDSRGLLFSAFDCCFRPNLFVCM